MNAPSAQNAGFTLIEALASALLMSIIFAALATVTAQWLPSWDRGALRLQQANLLALGLERLTGDISSAEFVSAGSGDQTVGQSPIFEGSELSVTFVRTTLAPNADTGLQVVRIAEISDDDGTALVRSTASLPTGGPGAEDADSLAFSNPVIVIRQPFRVSFSYAGPDRAWRDSWRGQTQLPRAVRVQVRDNATSALLAESTATMVYAELPAYCAWPNSTSDCLTRMRSGGATAQSAGGSIGAR